MNRWDPFTADELLELASALLTEDGVTYRPLYDDEPCVSLVKELEAEILRRKASAA